MEEALKSVTGFQERKMLVEGNQATILMHQTEKGSSWLIYYNKVSQGRICNLAESGRVNNEIKEKRKHTHGITWRTKPWYLV